MEKVLARLTLHREAAGSIGARGKALLDGLANGNVFVLHLLAGNDAGDILFLPCGGYIGKVKVENNTAPIRTERKDQVGIHDALVNVDHEVGINPEVPSTIAFAG